MKVTLGPYPEGEEERVVDIQVEDHDTWNVDHTLSMIALPLLKKFREMTQGAPCVDFEDVPRSLRPSEEEILHYKETGESDDKWFDRWDWILGEMIFAHEHIVSDEWEDKYHSEDGFDVEGYKKISDRRQRGLELFGKYYTGLWD